MIIECSNGHRFDLSNLAGRAQCGDRRPGDRCGVCVEYDRISGSTYCRRVLKQVGYVSVFKERGEWFWRIETDTITQSSVGYTTRKRAVNEGIKTARICKLKVYVRGPG